MSFSDHPVEDVFGIDEGVERPSGSRHRERWPWLFPLAGVLIFEWLANPMVAAVVGCLKFGLEDFRTALWLENDPNRSRGEALRWCFLTRSLFRVVWSAVLVFMGLVVLDGIWFVLLRGPAPLWNRNQLLDVGSAGMVIMVVCTILGVISACKAFRRVVRGQVRVWMDPTIHQARREQRWDVVCHGRWNRFHTLCGSAFLATSAWLAFLIGGLVLNGFKPPPGNVNPPPPLLFGLFCILFLGWPALYCLWLVIRCWPRAASSPAECWGEEVSAVPILRNTESERHSVRVNPPAHSMMTGKSADLPRKAHRGHVQFRGSRVMAACDFCGVTILWGGARDGDFVFCNEKCRAQGQFVALIEQIPPDLAEQRLRQVHQGRCPECGGAGPVDVHTSHQVTSVVVMTSWKSRPKVCCRSCGVKSQLGGIAWSAVLGWWGFPWGLLVTPIQIFRNVLGLIRPPNASEPTSQFRKMVNLELASQLQDRLRGRTNDEELDVLELAEVRDVEVREAEVLETEHPVPLPEPLSPRGAEPRRSMGTLARPSDAKTTTGRPQEATGTSTFPTKELPWAEDGGGQAWLVLGGLALALAVLVGSGVFAVKLIQAPRAAPIVKTENNANDGTVAIPGRQPAKDDSVQASQTSDVSTSARPSEARALKYGGTPGEAWVYEATIEIDKPDFVETYQGQLTYQITAVRASELDLTASGMLRPSRRSKAVHRGGFPGIPAPFGDMTAPVFGFIRPKQLTVDRTGKLIRSAEVTEPGFPSFAPTHFGANEPGYKGFLLDDAMLLPFERLANTAQSTWSLAQDLNVTLKEFVPLAPQSAFAHETESTLGGKETIEYSVKEATTSLVTLDKKYSLTAGGGGASVELSGQGWVRFDANAGATVSSEMKLTLKQTSGNVTVNVPIALHYRQLTHAEITAQREKGQAAIAVQAAEKEKQAAQKNAALALNPPRSNEPSRNEERPVTKNAAVALKTVGPLAPLVPTESLVLPQPAVDEQGQFLSDEALKAIFAVMRAPALGSAVTPETPLEVGSIVVAKKPGAGDRLAALREVKEEDKFVVGFLGDNVEPVEVTRAELRLPSEIIARFVSASAFAITPQTELRRGTLLETDRGGNRWRPVLVLETHADGKVKIRYIGWSSSWDSAVERTKLRFPTGMSSER